MGHIVGATGQQDGLFLLDGTVTLTGSPQLVLPRRQSTSALILQNLSAANSMAIEFGGARATCTLTNGSVTSFTITNAGFGYKNPPFVEFYGGGWGGNTAWSPVGLYGYPPPTGGGTIGRPAVAQAVLAGGAVSSFVIEDGGSGYQVAPFVYLRNSDLDPYGAAIPAVNSSGILLAQGTGPLAFNGTTCPLDTVSVIGTAADVLLVKWVP